MRIYVVRHGEAEGMVSTDAERRLTVPGRQQVLDIWRALRDQGVRPTTLVSSPYVRARQTATAIAEVFPELQPVIRPELTPDGSTGRVLSWLGDLPTLEGLVLVSHMPLVSLLTADLTDGAHTTFPVACVACIDLEVVARHAGRLLWLKSAI